VGVTVLGAGVKNQIIKPPATPSKWTLCQKNQKKSSKKIIKNSKISFFVPALNPSHCRGKRSLA
jgi:hypothetical protein